MGASYTPEVAPGLRIGRGLELRRGVGLLSAAVLRPVSGSGEDWNTGFRAQALHLIKELRPVSGSGEDWNAFQATDREVSAGGCARSPDRARIGTRPRSR